MSLAMVMLDGLIAGIDMGSEIPVQKSELVGLKTVIEMELENLRASPASVPEGYALVPVEPTTEMWAAVNKLDDGMAAGGYDGKGCSIEQAWNCLLAAAPTPPAEDRWLPIDTAPKDGRYGVGFHPTYANRFWLLSFNEAQTLDGFTHWLPLSKAPAMQEGNP